jgi:uncharacterized glyoxalase superfamily protein PhnB
MDLFMADQADINQVKIRNMAPIYFVKNRKTTLDYYSSLGFNCDYGMGFIERDGNEWIVHETKNVERITPNYPVHGDRDLALDMHFMVVNIERLFEEFKSKGAIIHSEISVNEYGMKVFSIIDPDGYTLAIGE